MKKIILTIVSIFVFSTIQGQTINDNLNTIIEAKPNGSLSTTKPYTYSVIEDVTNTLVVYFFDENLNCNQIVIVPPNAISRQLWIESVNERWVTIDSTNWKFYKDDGTVLVMFMDYLEDTPPIFIIREEKSIN